MSLPVPSKILREPFRKRIGQKLIFVLVTDVGAMALGDAAKRLGMTRSAMYHRLFCAKNTSWKDSNVFDQFIPKTRTEPIVDQPQQPMPSKKARRDPMTIKLGTWERREKVLAMYRMEETVKGLPARDRDYNDALKFNRAVAR